MCLQERSSLKGMPSRGSGNPYRDLCTGKDTDLKCGWGSCGTRDQDDLVWAAGVDSQGTGSSQAWSQAGAPGKKDKVQSPKLMPNVRGK